jgi:tetratricopeptide (TPR) repeat protein/precorrin-6B methylase 2
VLRAVAERAAERRYAAALALARKALAKVPDDAGLVAARGSILFEWGRLREAREDLAAAAAAGVDRPALLIQLGWSALWLGDAADAERWMRRAVATDPHNWQAHFGLGGALRAQRRCDESIAAYGDALALAPDSAEALAEIVGCHLDARRLDDALGAALHLRDAHPDDVAALATYASALIALDRLAEANAVYERIAASEAVRADPRLMPMAAGFSLLESGRVAEALAFYERNLPARPEPEAYVNYAFALLKAGRLREGFARYEFRWMMHPLIAQRPRFGRPVWRGQPLEGKSLLVMSEQGYGDIIQFLRYLPLVKARGARVLFLMYKPMPELFDERSGVDRVIAAGDPLPEFDYCLPLLGLPQVLGTDLDTIPQNVPYVFARDDRLARVRSRIPADDRLNVGLVWAGDPLGRRGRQKSLALSALEAWARIPGVRFCSLQKGDAAAEAAQPPAGLPLIDLSTEIRDFADTAAIIGSLDLVVSVCTSVAHLAGAMGKPVWTMLAEPADWRWLEGRDDTPWYPTMRLFRQPRRGDWASVVARVGDDLAALARDPSSSIASTGGANRPGADPVPRASPPAPNDAPVLCAAVETRHGIFALRPDGVPSERALHHYGEDLEPQLDLLRSRIRPGATVLEAGSGVGAHALALAAHVGAAGHLLVCEPRPALAALLQRNLAANAVHGVTTLHTSLLRAPTDRRAGPGLDDDASAPIDGLDLRRLDWLKIGEGMDAEGILDGAADTLWAHRPGVFAAVADEAELARVAGRLRDFGYHCRRVDTPRYRPDNFNRRDDDTFAGVVVHAVLAVPEESPGVVAAAAGMQPLD